MTSSTNRGNASGVLESYIGAMTGPEYAWRRWMHGWPWFFFAALSLATFIWLADREHGLTHWSQVLLLLAALIAWEQLWVRVVRSPTWGARPWMLALLGIVAVVLSIALTHLSIAFWLVGLALVPLFYVVLPLGWALLVSAALTAHVGWEARAATTTAPAPPTPVWAYLLSRVLIITMIGLFLRSVVRQAGRRQRLLDELESTRGELVAAERLAGTLEERQRVAREIHDTLAQGLSAIVVHLETAEQLLLPTDAAASGEGEGARAQVQRARAVARESLEETRRVMAALRPQLLERAELPEALARVAAQWSEETGISVVPAITGRPAPLHPEAEITLLRALQESLANVRKHARAGSVAVTLSYMEDLVVLDVRDDGVGFGGHGTGGGTQQAERRTSADGTSGFGLVAMRERVAQLGGSLTIESEKGEGTTLTVSLPRLHTAEMAIPQREQT